MPCGFYQEWSWCWTTLSYWSPKNSLEDYNNTLSGSSGYFSEQISVPELVYVSIMSKPCKRILCFHWNSRVTYWCVLYNIKVRFYNQSAICISIRSTPRKWTLNGPILAFLWMSNKFLYMLHQFIVLILCKIFSPSEIIFTNDENVFLRILDTNLRFLCFDIYAVPTMCTPYYHSRVNYVSEICLFF